MKTSIRLAACLFALTLTPVFGQPANQPPPLTKFNLNFPGGTPAQLVKAIQKATGKPLNVIIPDEDANIGLPPLKMDNVDVAQLFQTLGAASKKVETRNTSVLLNGGAFYGSPGYSYTTVTTGYGFKTDGSLSDNSIWYFYVDNPPQAPLSPPPPTPVKSCRFYQLAPYLDRGLTVDDITTAIQTGWKMMGDTETPEISFHKETKLLIAVGEPDKLEVIDNVLKALQPPPPNPTAVFQERLRQIIKNPQPSPVPDARAPLSPEEQMKLMEQNRRNGSQLPAADLPPPPSQSQKSPANPEAGQ